MQRVYDMADGGYCNTGLVGWTGLLDFARILQISFVNTIVMSHYGHDIVWSSIAPFIPPPSRWKNKRTL